MLPRLTLPPNRTLLALIAVAFVLPGLIGHDPWKPWDVVSAEVAHEMLRTGDWLVPRVAGEPLFDYPPLYYWIATVFGAVFGWAIAFHDAIRIASGALVLGSLALLALAAQTWSDAEERNAAPALAVLLLVGSLGLMVYAHDATPDLAALAACAGALAALGRAPIRPGAMGAAFGAALAAGFLASGAALPLALAATALLAPAGCPEWRRRWAARFLATAATVAVVLAALWPVALYARSGALFFDWWWEMLHPRGDVTANLNHLFGVASWFAWPAWPFALWTSWALRRHWREPWFFIPAVAMLAMLLSVAVMGSSHEARATVILAPMALLGAQGVGRLRRGAVAAFDWFGVMTFALFGALVWLGYAAVMFGVPAQLAANAARQAPGFAATFRLIPFGAAVVLTAAWLYLVLRTPPAPSRGITRWAAGVALLWGTLATLWLPWADHQRSYRGVAQELKAVIPPGSPCVAGKGFGLAQRAALDYHGQLRMARYDPIRPEACALVLVQGHPSHEYDQPGARWKKIAEVSRPGDRNERYRLYRLEQ